MATIKDPILISEAARLRGVTPQAIWDLISRGKIDSEIQLGRRVVSRSQVKRYKPGKAGRREGSKDTKKRKRGKVK
jgi:hypothetical protein